LPSKKTTCNQIFGKKMKNERFFGKFVCLTGTANFFHFFSKKKTKSIPQKILKNLFTLIFFDYLLKALIFVNKTT